MEELEIRRNDVTLQWLRYYSFRTMALLQWLCCRYGFCLSPCVIFASKVTIFLYDTLYREISPRCQGFVSPQKYSISYTNLFIMATGLLIYCFKGRKNTKLQVTHQKIRKFPKIF